MGPQVETSGSPVQTDCRNHPRVDRAGVPMAAQPTAMRERQAVAERRATHPPALRVEPRPAFPGFLRPYHTWDNERTSPPTRLVCE